YVLKFGIKHIAHLVESRKARLVVIAVDVDYKSLVIWLPALCRRMKVPYVIVKDKARLGSLVNKRYATAVAFTAPRLEDSKELTNLIEDL
ncbi:50S ribosomal protein L30e-like protein, partial [Dissophora ornata]